jgi:NTP pyrophosphatase (non-canonical NTP hydrolase)
VRGVVAAFAVVAVATAGCVSPSRTDDDYRHKAANTAQTVASSLQTARLGVKAAVDGKTFGPYLTRLLAEAEEDAEGAQAAFDAVQPPSEHADAIHDELADLLTDALDTLRGLRIAVRRSDLAKLRETARPLGELADKLDEFQDHVT